MDEVIVSDADLTAVAGRRKRALVLPINPRLAVGDVLALRVASSGDQTSPATVFVNVTHIEVLDRFGVCVLSIEPRITTGGFRLDLENGSTD